MGIWKFINTHAHIPGLRRLQMYEDIPSFDVYVYGTSCVVDFEVFVSFSSHEFFFIDIKTSVTGEVLFWPMYCARGSSSDGSFSYKRLSCYGASVFKVLLKKPATLTSER